MTAGIGATLLLSYRNYSDAGVISENNVSPSDWTETLPLANLQNRQPTKVARSTNLQPDFIVDLGRNRTITFVALLFHNLTANGTWRVRLSRDSDFSTILYDSGTAPVWPITNTFGSLPWGEFSWNGRAVESGGNNAILTLPTSYLTRYLLVNLSDVSNSSGYLQAGRLIVDAPWRPSKSVQFGWSTGQSKRSKKSRSRGGQVWTDNWDEYKVLTFDLAGIGEDEMYSNGFNINNIKGVTGDLFAMIDPSDLINRHRYSVYGTQVNPGDITQRTHKDFARPFSIEESR